MAANFNKAYNTIHDEIIPKVSELLSVMALLDEEKVKVKKVGEFKFTNNQKTSLKNDKDALKAEIIALIGALP